jgi:hypothetical protein
MKILYDSNRFIFTEQAEGMAGFKAKVEEIKPDVIFHDYWKSLADDEMGDRSAVREVNFVNRTIDRLVDYTRNKMKIPTFLCGHANREGDKSGGKSSTEHAWSDHITRRVDIAMRVICFKDLIALIINEGRSIRRHMSFTVDGTLCSTFGDFISEDTSWVKKALAAQDEEEDSEDRNKPLPKGTGKGGAFRRNDFRAQTSFQVKRASSKKVKR